VCETTGIGIEPEKLDETVQRFEQAERSTHAALRVAPGLGLAITKAASRSCWAASAVETAAAGERVHLHAEGAADAWKRALLRDSARRELRGETSRGPQRGQGRALQARILLGPMEGPDKPALISMMMRRRAQK